MSKPLPRDHAIQRASLGLAVSVDFLVWWSKYGTKRHHNYTDLYYGGKTLHRVPLKRRGHWLMCYLEQDQETELLRRADLVTT